MDRPPNTEQDVPISNVERLPENSNYHHQRLSMKRKKALLSLLNEIASLNAEDIDAEAVPEDTWPAHVNGRAKDLIVDDRGRSEDSALFQVFEQRVIHVDEQLLNFSTATRPLGSSVGLISSSYNLRARLQQILHLFRENASEAFPNKIKKVPVKPLQPLLSRKQLTKFRNSAVQPRLTRETSDLEEFPHQFELLARDLVTFLHFLHDIPELGDESLIRSVLSFEEDLQYWASCLRDFKGQFGLPPTQRYVNGLTREMGEHLGAIRDAFISFVQDGVPRIKMAQVDAQNGLLNLSSVAAFFSGIAATTIQYIIDKIDTRLQQVVVTLWIASIIFGIGAAVNSQLAYQWRAAMYRSPQSAIPGFASFWLTRTPLVFLALSIIAFSAGLLCYAYSSFQGTLVTACTTVFTCLASLAPFSVAVWLATERLVFAKAEGRRTSQNLTREWRGVSRRRTWLIWVPKAPLSWLKKVAIRSIEVLRKFGDSLSSTIERPTARRGSSSMGRNLFDMEEYAAGLPTPTTATKAEMMRWFSNVSDPKPIRAQSPPPVHQAFETHEISSSPVQERAPWLGPGHHTTPPQDSAQDPPPPPTSPTPKMTFEDDARKVRSLERMKPTPKLQTKIGLENHARERSLTLPSSPDGQADSNERYAPRPARLAGLIPELKALKPMQEISERGGLVRHLQFSPDGKWLATCGHGTKALIWKVEETVSLHRFILHPGTELLSQVAWSPDGKYLLTRGFRHAKVWVAETGVLMKSIRCISKIEDVTWMPSGDSFTCVEGSVVHIRDLKGKINADHPFKRLDIHDVAVTHDEQRMVLVASLQSSGDDLIIVYHLGNEKVECQVSVLKNIRNVTISSDTSNGYLALISYEGTATPELWRISVVNTEDHQEARLQLLQTYMPTAVMEFAGPSYLGGTHDQFVIGTGRKGNIHIWDRETGLLLHSLQGANIIGNTPEDLTAVGWNNCATGRYMFASGTSGGTIRIWTAEEAPPDSRLPSRTGSPTPSGPV